MPAHDTKNLMGLPASANTATFRTLFDICDTVLHASYTKLLNVQKEPMTMSKTVVCKVNELPSGKAKRVSINGKDIAVFNSEGNFYAIQNMCPHKAWSLSEGEVEGTTVTCPGHGWMFDLKTGNGVSTPIGVQKYNVYVENENIILED
jgi:NAD(P)H-dependent nitrite reductase small subunit